MKFTIAKIWQVGVMGALLFAINIKVNAQTETQAPTANFQKFEAAKSACATQLGIDPIVIAQKHSFRLLSPELRHEMGACLAQSGFPRPHRGGMLDGESRSAASTN